MVDEVPADVEHLFLGDVVADIGLGLEVELGDDAGGHDADLVAAVINVLVIGILVLVPVDSRHEVPRRGGVIRPGAELGESLGVGVERGAQVDAVRPGWVIAHGSLDLGEAGDFALETIVLERSFLRVEIESLRQAEGEDLPRRSCYALFEQDVIVEAVGQLVIAVNRIGRGNPVRV